ncbi:MAG TPA: RNB domain-containing ribonuclease [Oleiagrimonas sp.]|nr:RNB domain-containing ribonuclease [Oleiagrimonas sp.]
MPTTRRLRIRSPHDRDFERDIVAIRQELQLPANFPDEVVAAAAEAARHPRLPELDRTDIPFITIDPPGAMDLDQALHVERRDNGYRVHYAIADVAAFVSPGDAVDKEAHQRGETLYGADRTIPLHPRSLSEDAASLLPGKVRPALLWSIDVDESGEGVHVDVRRACVKSRNKLDYDGVQAGIDAGRADPMWDLVREVGELRMRRQQQRGAISLGLPEQEIGIREGQWALEYRARLPVEDWNEQMSLLTGMAAAHLMVKAGVGLLRTLPEAEPHTVARLRRAAHALEIDWPEQQPAAVFINGLDPSNPTHVAMMLASTRMLRGAGYIAFNGELPEYRQHAALAAEYTHATAPLRRLVDRYTGEICVALCAGEAVPSWVLDALPDLPDTMREAGHRASRFEHAVLDLVEAVILENRIGETFAGSIIDVDHDHPERGDAMVRMPAIEARVDGDGALPLGQRVKLKLVQADPALRRVRFQCA